MPKVSTESSINHIHRFKNPPLIETVLGVQFKNVPKMNNELLYGFKASLGAQWPIVEEAPLLPPSFEKFDDSGWMAAMMNVQFQMMPMALRLRIFDSNRSRMIQVQNGRFHYNWIRTEAEQYPTYSVIRPQFNEFYGLFKKYLAEHGINSLDEDQWEVTYISHIPKGDLWKDVGEIQKIFPDLPSIKTDNLRSESFLTQLDFEIKPQQGRLHLRINNVKDQKSVEAIRTDFTARGPISSEKLNLDRGLNLGRQAIVETFLKSSSSEAHNHWGYNDAH